MGRLSCNKSKAFEGNFMELEVLKGVNWFVIVHAN